MLQNQGWSEGEGLGAGSKSSLRRRSNAHAKETLQEKGKKTRLDSLSPPAPAPMLPTSPAQEPATKEEQEEEIIIDDDDDDPIIEVRKKAPVPMIDLTQSDTEDPGEDDDDDDIYSPASSPAPPNVSSPTDPDAPGDPRAAQTALLTPLPTILKSDRLGIGLKAKTEGPYRSSVKRRVAKRNAAAEDMHIRRILLGKGHRAFARRERLERETRQNMMAYLSEP
jgi:G-patch domain